MGWESGVLSPETALFWALCPPTQGIRRCEVLNGLGGHSVYAGGCTASIRMAMGCLGLHGGEPQAGIGLPLCPFPLPTSGSLRCLRWDVDLVIISKISALKTLPAPPKSNLSSQSNHSPVSSCVLEGRGYMLCNDAQAETDPICNGDPPGLWWSQEAPVA